jgi:hypothetical protein
MASNATTAVKQGSAVYVRAQAGTQPQLASPLLPSGVTVRD